MNAKHPLYSPSSSYEAFRLDDIVETVVNKMGSVKKIILVGDYARGYDSGRIEVFLLGDDLNTEYIEQLAPKIESVIDRQVSFYLTSRFNYDQNHIVLYEEI